MSTILTETDVFQFYEKAGAKINDKIKALLTNPAAAVIVNEKIESTLTRFAQSFKEPIALKAVNAIRTGDLVLFVTKPEFNLPDCMPFFRYVLKGSKAKVGINLSNIVTIHESVNAAGDVVDGETEYTVDDMRKFYAVIVASYIQLKIPDPAAYPIKAIEYGAIMWARMFCKVLNRTIGLASNKGRYEAYFYFAARFYLKYYIGAPDTIVDSVSMSLLKSGVKSPLIAMIEDNVNHDEELSSGMYSSFTGFCNVLFNNDISNIKGMRMVSANPDEKLNVSFYLRRFVDSYNQSAIMSLASTQYFTWMVLCVQKKAYMMNIKMLADVFETNEGIKYISALCAEAIS